MAEPSAYPLSWPFGWPRTTLPQRSRFGGFYKKPTLTASRAAIVGELRILRVDRAVISTNATLRRDGLPYNDQPEPPDTGAAVYFDWQGKPYVLACDRWNTVGDNLWAIAKHLEAWRGQYRWGVGSAEQAFAGYLVRPAPVVAAAGCWTVLGLAPGSSPEAINAVYRALSLARHPDRGGSHAAMAALNRAREEALATSRGEA